MRQYIVKPNDTLFLIAKEFGIPLAQLIQANPQISNPHLIYEGQTIIIPDMPMVPDQIGRIEENAIGVMEDVIMGNWPGAMQRADVIRTDLNQLTPIMQQAQVPNHVVIGLHTALRAMEQNIINRRTFPAISQANRITQLLADALDYFNVIIPTDVMRLAYFARQIIVNVEQNDWAEAFQNYRRALAAWQRIRPELAGSYDADVAAFDQVLEDINGAIDRRDYGAAINYANRMLELTNVLTDDFEQLYT